MAILDVRLISDPPGGPASYSYEFRSSGGHAIGPVEQGFPVEVDQDLVQEICAALHTAAERSPHTTLDGPVDHVGDLRRWGQILHQALFPVLEGDVRDLVERLHACDQEPLLIRTNEALVPWELLNDGEEFLGLSHDVARQSYVHQRVHGGRVISAIARALLVADPRRDLPEARYEAENLQTALENQGVACTLLSGSRANLAAVVSHLSSGDYDLLHYSGHVAAGPGASEASMVLHDEKLLRVRSIRAVLSRGSPPVVFINGCMSAEPLSNLCSAFMTTGSQVVIGTRFQVVDGSARALAQSFYSGLAEGRTAGAAMRAARRGIVSRPDAGWAAFILFGDPALRIQAGPGPGPGGEPSRTLPVHGSAEATARPADTVGSPGARGLDGPAIALLRRAMGTAATRGWVTSLDLLVEMLETHGPLRACLAARGADLVAVIEALRGILGPPQPAPDGKDTRLSASVEVAVAFAVDSARRAGRPEASVADLTDGLLGTDAGNAGKLLAQAGLPLTPGGELGPPPGAAGLAGQRGGVSPFDDVGDLRAGWFAHSTVTALHAARLFAGASHAVIGSGVMLVGFGLAGNSLLRACLEHQGATEQKQVRGVLSAANPLQAHASTLRRADFSTRAAAALARALEVERSSGAPWVGDAAVLAELLADDTGTVIRVLDSWGVEPAQLRLSLEALRTPPGTLPGGGQ